MGRRYCSVEGCYSCDKRDALLGIQFHRFPVREPRRQLWLQAVGRQNPDGTPWIPGESARVCSLHFPDQKKSNLPGSPNYVPSIFPHQNGWVQPTASDKFKRSLKRKRIKAEQKLLDIENETLFPEVMIKVETPSDLVDQSVQTSENINTEGLNHFQWQYEVFPEFWGTSSAATQACIPRRNECIFHQRNRKS